MIRHWLASHWVAGALFMAGALLLLVPVMAFGVAEFIIYLASPLYMLHQVEEHAGDRFRSYVNRVVFGGAEALTVCDVLWINLPGVWGLNLLALYGAHFLSPGWGLSAVYVILVNGLAHLVMALRFRGYNPGLATGALAFVPFGIAGLLLVPATLGQHVFALAVAIAFHAAILAVVKRNVARPAAG